MSKVVSGGVGNPDVSSLEKFCYVPGFFSYVCKLCPFFSRVVLCISSVFCVFRIGVGMVVVRMQDLMYDLFFFLFTMYDSLRLCRNLMALNLCSSGWFESDGMMMSVLVGFL
jgi:hypothetical protein